MIVDDRLDTVLQTHAAGRAGLNTQLRQLIDILGRMPDAQWADHQDQALDRLDSLHAALGDGASAVLVGLCTLRSPRLIAHLVTCGPRTAFATIERAQLDDGQWAQLVPALPIHARGALRHRRDLSPVVTALLERLGIDDFVLTAPVPLASEPVAATSNLVQLDTHRPAAEAAIPAAPASEPAREGVGAIVRRIEAFRRNRQEETRNDPGQTSLPFAEDVSTDIPAAAVDIDIDASGTIVAADGVDQALLVGHMPFAMASAAAAASVDPATLQAFRARQPIVAGALMLDGAPRISGNWRIDAVPRFGDDGGQYIGYRARLRRPPQLTADGSTRTADIGDGEILQQLLHELRTPINAIQGFAELIQQQMLGPAPHQYRSLAASIAADAARMLAGFEDVERLIRLESGHVQIDPGQVDLAAIMTRLVAQLEPLVTPRGITLHWAAPVDPMPVALDPVEAERMIWRLLSTVIGAAAPGERVNLSLASDATQGQARFTLTLPSALAQRDAEALFSPDPGRTGNGMDMLGHGFSLRLVLAEIAALGGRLDRPAQSELPALVMALPLARPVALDRTLAAS